MVRYPGGPCPGCAKLAAGQHQSMSARSLVNMDSFEPQSRQSNQHVSPGPLKELLVACLVWVSLLSSWFPFVPVGKKETLMFQEAPLGTTLLLGLPCVPARGRCNNSSAKLGTRKPRRQDPRQRKAEKQAKKPNIALQVS